MSLAAIQRGFRVEMDRVGREEWYRCLSLFDDANIHQAWDYESAMYPRKRVSRLVLFNGDDVAGMAQVAWRAAPLLGRGIARVRYGPVWRRKGASPDPEALAALAQALRKQFVSRRKLLTCIVPQVDSENDGGAAAALEAQGFTRSASSPMRTIILDLSPPAEEIRAAFSGNWRRHLRRAEGNGLEVIEGVEEPPGRLGHATPHREQIPLGPLGDALDDLVVTQEIARLGEVGKLDD